MNRTSTHDALASARALAGEVLGTAPVGQTERELLEAIAKVRKLANPSDTDWVLELCAAYIQQRRAGR